MLQEIKKNYCSVKITFNDKPNSERKKRPLIVIQYFTLKSLSKRRSEKGF